MHQERDDGGGHRVGNSSSSSSNHTSQATEQGTITTSSNSSETTTMGDKSSAKQENGSASTVTGDNVKKEQNGKATVRRTRRSKIPDRPNHYINLWNIMKNCIGKELTKIPMPVNFNEPLSMLQRIAENYEYSHLLDRAADPLLTKSDAEQLALVAAFAVSSYSSTGERLGKPFNPLLHETYECDRMEDLGWKYIAEQVLHHPPVLASHCRGKRWTAWNEFSLNSKFRGKYLSVSPTGVNHLVFDSPLGGQDEHNTSSQLDPDQGVLEGKADQAAGNHYTWNKVTTAIHNIIVGKLWVDNHGEMLVTNHTTGHVAKIQFQKYKSLNFFSKADDTKLVDGSIVDREGNTVWRLRGHWDMKMEAQPEGESTWTTIWERELPPKEHEKIYNMSRLAVQLNEPEPGVAPTDSRLRPDQRLMEEGKWDDANRVKGQLEDAQRARRREKEKQTLLARGERPLTPKKHAGNMSPDDDQVPDTDLHTPTWFRATHDQTAGRLVYTYTGEYWPAKESQEWSGRLDEDIFKI